VIIPANYLHSFVAAPLLLIFAIQSARSYSQTHNQVGLLLGLGSFWYFLCVLFYGFPAVLSMNTQMLTWFTVAAAICEFLGGMFFWVAVTRIYAAKNVYLRRAIIISTVLVVLVGSVLAFRDVLAIPVKIIQEGGEYLIYSPVSREYSILIAIQYLSCIFLSVAFWRQSNTAQFLRDKFRLRILAVTLGVAGVVLGLLPFTQGGTGVLTKNQSIQLSVAFLFLALFLAITLFIKPRQQSK
jgi:hypothetical protein